MIRLVVGDICTFDGDAIVNAANPTGPGLGNSAIHRAAGPRLQAACRDLPCLDPLSAPVRIPIGVGIPTPAFNLPCKWVIHTAGPIWTGTPQDQELLADCYRKPLLVALGMGLKSIAYPAISAGVYGCPHGAPMHDCARIALSAVYDAPIVVTFYLWPNSPKDPNLAIWSQTAHELGVAEHYVSIP